MTLSEEDISRWRRRKQRLMRIWIGQLQFERSEQTWPELETTECSDLITRCRRTGWLEISDEWMPEDDSDDSYNRFIQRNKVFALDAGAEARHQAARVAAQKRQAQKAAKAREAQERWEAEQRRRQEAKEAEARRLWEADQAQRRARERAAQEVRRRNLQRTVAAKEATERAQQQKAFIKAQTQSAIAHYHSLPSPSCWNCICQHAGPGFQHALWTLWSGFLEQSRDAPLTITCQSCDRSYTNPHALAVKA